MADGVGSIGGSAGAGEFAPSGGLSGSFDPGGLSGPGTDVTLDEISVIGGPPEGGGGPPRPSSTSPSILAQQSILSQSQAGDAATAQSFSAFLAENSARASAAQSQFDANQAASNASTARLFAGPNIIGPTTPPGSAFGLDGPVAPPGIQDVTQGGATLAVPAAAPGPTLAGAAAAARLAPTFGELAGDALGSLAGRLPTGAQILGLGGDVLGGLLLRAGGVATGIFAFGTGNIPSDAQESAMRAGTETSLTYADGSPRIPNPGASLLDPTPLGELAAPLTPPTLADGFTAPPPPATLTPPAALTPLPGAVAPLPGFTPAPALSGLEGLTPIAPGGFGALPGFAAMPPAGLVIPGFTPASPTPALPGFVAVEPRLTGPQVLENQATTREQALADVRADLAQQGIVVLTDADPEVKRYMDDAARRQGIEPSALQASTLGNMIFVREGQQNDVRVLREELIHTQQQKGMVLGADTDSRTPAELQARQILLQNADRWALTPQEVQEIQQEIQTIQSRGRY